MADFDADELGDWYTPETMRAAWDSLPSAEGAPGDLGWDIVAAAKGDCVTALEGQGKPVPADGAVPASYRLAQLFFARALNSSRVTNAGAETAGLPGYDVPAFAFRKLARDELGYGDLGIG